MGAEESACAATLTRRHSVAGLTGVSETLLWTLHNRASEAARADGVLHDPLALRIRDAIDCDLAARFGAADGAHAFRARLFDAQLQPWLAAHPGGTVVELAAGLETQFHRVDDGRVQWYCVDLAPAIALRTALMPPCDRCHAIVADVTDRAWMAAIPPTRHLLVTAQGLLMYLEPTAVEQLLRRVLHQWPGATLLFDTLPTWLSNLTRRGFALAPGYVVPPMPWGVAVHDVPPLIRRWMPGVHSVEAQPWGFSRRPLHRLFARVSQWRAFHRQALGIVRVEGGNSWTRPRRIPKH
jgi:hypothetical protein